MVNIYQDGFCLNMKGSKMGYTEEDCIEDTNKHLKIVKDNIDIIMNELHSRILNHDLSKLEDPELSDFTKLTPKLKESTYGSEEYKGFLKELTDTLRHHYHHNRHHPEHFTPLVLHLNYPDEISAMNLIDMIEMFCDWLAATKRHKDGNIFKSIDFNEKRFSISPQLSAIFYNTAEQIFREEKRNDI